MNHFPLLLAAAFALAGCKTVGSEQALNNSEPAPVPPGWVACPDERPQMCTRIYEPVCAWLPATNTWKTYPSDCTACADRHVAGHRPGKCH